MAIMKALGTWILALLGITLLAVAPVAAADQSPFVFDRGALPSSAWWLVLHDQCADTLHWINSTGEFASIPRPAMPNEAAGTPCSAKALHISQNGRYLVQIAMLSDGRAGVGFYDLETGQWLHVHEADINEFAVLGARYSSAANNHIAIGFANEQTAPRAWRVILFDMATGNALDQLSSSGPEIASFVGGEFLTTAETVPSVTLVTNDEVSGADAVHIRFDILTGGESPFGALVWYPAGAPGIAQELLSGPYTAADIDVLPDGQAIFAYTHASYPAGPPLPEALMPPETNAIGVLRPESPGELGTTQLFYADGLSTLYAPRWGADGQMALFRRYDGTTTQLNWITVGSAVLIPLTQEVAQVIGVPEGFVYSVGDSIYYVNKTTGASTGPVYSSPALTGSMAFVWASAFGDPPLALNYPAASAPAAGPVPLIVTATPDTGTCRIRSADAGAVNIRSGPDVAYPVIGQLASGTQLDVIGYNGQWYVVNYTGMQGWMAGWVSTLSGNCTGLAFTTPSGPPPATPVPTSPPPGPSVSTPLPSAGQPDLYVSEFALDPATPLKGQAVNVRVGVYNQGEAAATATFHIAWWPGENYPAPACEWDLDGLVARGGRILTCTYAGYPSSYASINTRVVVDTGNTVAESNESNNAYTQAISVLEIAPAPTGQPDLYVSEFTLDPPTPLKGQAVNVRIGVYNQGNAAATTPFNIAWWPGENYASPACTWSIDSMAARGGRILTCTYAGYPSPYASINTRVVVDTSNTVAESNESNNAFIQAVTVNNP